MAKVNLSPPWTTYYKEVCAMFENDLEVKVIFDEENYDLKIYVNNGEKAVMLDSLMPDKKEFGGVTLKIYVIPSNPPSDTLRATARAAKKEVSVDRIFRIVFNGNDAFSYARTIHGAFMSNDLVYVVFNKRVVQYYNDDLGDINGMCSTLYQNIAKDIFKPIDGVFYCTDTVLTEEYIEDERDAPHPRYRRYSRY